MEAPFKKWTISGGADCCEQFGELHISIALPSNWSEMSRPKFDKREEWESNAVAFIESAIQEALERARKGSDADRPKS